MNKLVKGWKTVVFGVLLALISIFSNEEMAQFFAENLQMVGTFTGTIIVVLRAITNSGIFQKE